MSVLIAPKRKDSSHRRIDYRIDLSNENGRRANWKVYRVDPRAPARDRRTRPPRVLEPARGVSISIRGGRSRGRTGRAVPTRDVVNAARERIHLRVEGVTASFSLSLVARNQLEKKARSRLGGRRRGGEREKEEESRDNKWS